MKASIFCFILSIFFVINVHAMFPNIYSDADSIVTGRWSGNGTLTNTANSPCEGIRQLQFSYTSTNSNPWWAGMGLNFNNWSTSLPGIKYDFSTRTHISVTYKGLSTGQKLRIILRNNYASVAIYSNEVIVGGPQNNCTTVEIPISSFTEGTNFDITSVTEIDFNISGPTAIFSGTVYIDDIHLVNGVFPPEVNNNWLPANNTAWKRCSTMSKGVNFANWLEAYWLLPYNSYPEVNKYNRTLVQNLNNLGFKSIRLPVTFEQIAANLNLDTIPNNNKVWAMIDSTIAWANDFDMNLSICNHHGLPLTDDNYAAQIPRIKKIWGQVARRYKNLNPDKFFLELYNEPNELNNANFRIVALALIDTVRAQTTSHTLILGGTQYNSSNGLATSLPYPDSNVIYTFHSYDPFSFTHQGLSWTSPPYFAAEAYPLQGSANAIKNVVKQAGDWGKFYKVPVMLGEFGVSSAADATSRCNYIDSIANNTAKYTMPWYYWDAISTNDAFGFVSGNGTNALTCFANKLKLGSSNTCAKIVSSKQDLGIGSLREQIACANNGDTITFAPSLIGDTISLEDKPIFLLKSLVLRNTNATNIHIKTNGNNALMYIDTNKSISLEGITLYGKINQSLLNHGNLTLENSTIKMDANTEFLNNGNLIIKGSSTIKQ